MEENEAIDVSQWLPRNAPVVNRFRLAQGDLTGNIDPDTKRITHAEVCDKSIARKLIEIGFLEEFHRYYGLTLLDLQKAFYGPLNAKSNSIYIAMISERNVPSNHAANMYSKISRKMAGNGIKIIVEAMDQPYKQIPIWAINVYREEFERLVTVMDEVFAETKAIIEKELAGE